MLQRRTCQLRMTLLDTHLISEPLRMTGDVAVLDWTDAQAIETLYISTISLD
jgi:toxin FitB